MAKNKKNIFQINKSLKNGDIEKQMDSTEINNFIKKFPLKIVVIIITTIALSLAVTVLPVIDLLKGLGLSFIWSGALFTGLYYKEAKQKLQSFVEKENYDVDVSNQPVDDDSKAIDLNKELKVNDKRDQYKAINNYCGIDPEYGKDVLPMVDDDQDYVPIIKEQDRVYSLKRQGKK